MKLLVCLSLLEMVAAASRSRFSYDSDSDDVTEGVAKLSLQSKPGKENAHLAPKKTVMHDEKKKELKPNQAMESEEEEEEDEEWDDDSIYGKKPEKKEEDEQEEEEWDDDSIYEKNPAKKEDEEEEEWDDDSIYDTKPMKVDEKKREEKMPEKEKPEQGTLTEKQKAEDLVLLQSNVNQNLKSIKPNYKSMLGEGGFGKVYLSGDGKYAIKIAVLKDDEEEEKSVAEIIHDTLQETKVMSLVGNDHADIVKYYGYTLGEFVDPNNPYGANEPVECIQVFLEPLTGDTLDHFIPRKQFPAGTSAAIIADDKRKKPYHHLNVQQVILLTRKVLQALVYLHGKKIIHGDIKPSNLFLTDDGQVKVIDFGGAQIIGDKTFINEVYSKDYFPVEYGENTFVKDAHYDLYSLGITIRELLTGSKTPTTPTVQQQGNLLLLQMLDFCDHLLSDSTTSASDALAKLDRELVPSTVGAEPPRRIRY